MYVHICNNVLLRVCPPVFRPAWGERCREDVYLSYADWRYTHYTRGRVPELPQVQNISTSALTGTSALGLCFVSLNQLFGRSQCADRDGASPPADGLLPAVWRHQRPPDRSGTSGAVRPPAGGARGVRLQGNKLEREAWRWSHMERTLSDWDKTYFKVMGGFLCWSRWLSGGWRSWGWVSMRSRRLEATAEATRGNSPQPSPSSGLRLLYSWWRLNC